MSELPRARPVSPDLIHGRSAGVDGPPPPALAFAVVATVAAARRRASRLPSGLVLAFVCTLSVIALEAIGVAIIGF